MNEELTSKRVKRKLSRPSYSMSILTTYRSVI